MVILALMHRVELITRSGVGKDIFPPRRIGRHLGFFAFLWSIEQGSSVRIRWAYPTRSISCICRGGGNLGWAVVDLSPSHFLWLFLLLFWVDLFLTVERGKGLLCIGTVQLLVM